MADMLRVDAAATYGLDYDNSTSERIGLVKAAGTTQGIIFRNGAAGHGSFRGDIGNADITLTEAQANGFLFCNTALTAERTITMPATGQPNAVLWVAHRASATGAFNLTVRSSTAATLKAITAASTYAVFAYNAGGVGGWLYVGTGTI